MTTTTVAAVVVDYHAGDHLLACIRSLRAEQVGQIVVVDNASPEPSALRVADADPEVRVLRMDRNLGYGGGVNRGIATLASDAVLVLNPDTVVHPGAVAALVAALEADAGIGAVGPAIETGEGSVYPSARTFPGLLDSLGHAFLGLVWPANPFTRRYRMLGWDHRDAREVDWVSGACFLVRREAFAAVGGFDETYFMYSEDVDLFWRLGRAGWRVTYEPSARVTHVQGVSTAHHPYRMIVAHHVSLLRFAQRSTRGARRALLPVVALGLALRAVLVAARRVLGHRTI